MNDILMYNKLNFPILNIFKNNNYLFNNYIINKELNKYFFKLINVYYLKLQFYNININKNFLLNSIIASKLKKLNKILLFVFCSFMYSKIFLKVGLGFRKKIFFKR